MHRTLIGAMTAAVLYTLNALALPAVAADTAAQLLVYRVTETGSEPYISRILVTEEHLRMDQGQADDGFILLDRLRKVIYSVNSQDNTVLEISPRQQLKELPEGMIVEAKITQEQGLPELSGRKTEYWRFFVNGRLCRSAMVAPGLMLQAIRAYGEYLELLAFQHLATLQAVPQEMQDPCDMAVNIFEPLAVIDKGLPLRDWVEQGRLLELIDYRESFALPDGSFKLPDDFHHTTVGDL